MKGMWRYFFVLISLAYFPGLFAQEYSGPDSFYGSPIKRGMNTEEVRELIGKPYYIAGSKDPAYYQKRQEQLEQQGFYFDIWTYQTPYNFIIYFLNGRVFDVVYVGGSPGQTIPQSGQKSSP